MPANPLVSFCMSTYKRPQLLQQQLERLLKQDYPHFEIIVSDNDPEGSAAAVIDALGDSRIRYFVNPQNLGMVKSFNHSLQQAAGEFTVMITDDDPAYPFMLSTLVPLTEQYPGLGLYAGCGEMLVENEYSRDTLNMEMGANTRLLENTAEGTVIQIAGDEFPFAYFAGRLSKVYLLWSLALVRREVALQIKGMPDYGSELFTDHAYISIAGSIRGAVFINKILGGQAIHGGNFGYNFFAIREKYIGTPGFFFGYMENHLQQRPGWDKMQKALWDFAGRGYVEYSLMIFRSLKNKQNDRKAFFEAFNKAFAHPGIHKWKYKFYLKAYFPGAFRALLWLKNKITGG